MSLLPDVNISDAEVELAVTSLKSVGDLPLHELQFAPHRGVKVSFRTFDREDSCVRVGLFKRERWPCHLLATLKAKAHTK